MLPLCVIALVVAFAFGCPLLIGVFGVKAFVAAIVSCAHIFAIALVHQLAAYRATSARMVCVSPIVHEGLCDNVLARVFIPLVKVECCEVV